MSQRPETTAAGRGSEAGFTLVEALTAIVILIFGLMAVTNLMLVAASSNTVANHGTAATTSASQAMDFLKMTPYGTLVAGGAIVSPPPVPANPCAAATALDFACFDDIPGVGRIITQWQITPVAGTARAIFIRVRSEGTGALAAARSRAEFTLVRACTDSSPPTGGLPPCPPPP